MATALCTPNERLLIDLKKLFEGQSMKDVDGKSRNIGNIINKWYGKSDTAYGREMFDEIVWRSTYSTSKDYEAFKDADFRRIAREIEKEAKKLSDPNISWIERLGFVKRGVMAKFAATNWFNKRINSATNYERVKNSTYVHLNRQISKLLRQQVIIDGGQSIAIAGIKAERDIDKFDMKLFEILYEIENTRKTGGDTSELRQQANEARAKVVEVLGEGGGKVLSDFIEYMHTRPDADGVVRKENGTEYSRNIEEAARFSRTLLDEMGSVFVNGLNQQKQNVREAFLNTTNMSEVLPGRLKSKIESFERRVDSEIAAIKEGMTAGDYFPHYIMEGMVKLNKLMEVMEEKPVESDLDAMDNILTEIKKNMTQSPYHTRHRKQSAYDNWIHNPLAVLRKYSLDAIAFNKGQHLKSYYMRTVKHMPKPLSDGEAHSAMSRYVKDVYQIANKGYTDRPMWVNKATRVLTGYEFFSKIGFGIGTAARNTVTGLYYLQGLGNRAFKTFLTDWNGKAFEDIKNEIKKVEEEQGFKFADLAEELYTEGMVPVRGVKESDIDMTLDNNGKTMFRYRHNNTWKAIDAGLSYATGKSAIFQRLTENMLRKYMFRSAFLTKYQQLQQRGNLNPSEIISVSKFHALDMVNKYAFEYAAHQKAPLIGGTTKNLGGVGQVMFQFMHFPMSFLQLQSEVLRKSKDAALARQWKNPDLVVPLRFAGLALATHLASGIFNRDLTRIMENDTVDRIKDIIGVLEGKEDVKGRGYIGPAVGDLVFAATMAEWIRLPESEITKLIIGYNDAYQLTDKQKISRLWSTLNVEASKTITKTVPQIMSGRGYNFTMNELGLYPKAWTRDLHKKIFGKHSIIGKKKKKKEAKVLSKEIELTKLYRSMESFAKGGQFITKGPKAIIVGDNPSGREKVTIEPLGKIPKSKGPAKYNKFDMKNLDTALSQLGKTEKEESEIYSAKNNRRMTLSDEQY